jgi:hypothetical protein
MVLVSTQPLHRLPGIFLGSRGGQWEDGHTYHVHVPIDLKSGNPKFLEPYGPVIGLKR